MAGFIVLNETLVDYNTRNYQSDLHVLIHELFHTMFFDPELFEKHYPSYNNETFYFDDNGIKKLRGQASLSTIREHFNCPSVNGSILQLY